MQWDILYNNLLSSKYYFGHTKNGVLLKGDCVEILQSGLLDNSIDLIITSPPYNVGIDYNTYKDLLPINEYFTFVKSFLQGFYQVLKEDGRFGINILIDINMKLQDTKYRKSPLCEYYKLLEETNLNYYTIISLYETNPHRVKYTAWGSWLNQSSPYIYNPFEIVLLGYKKQWTKQQKEDSDLTKEEFMELVSGSWGYRAETRGYTKANFSLDLPIKAIKGLAYKNNIVIDPFMGSGTTAIAAEQLGRKWIGIELDEKYCTIAMERIKKEISAQKSKLF